MNNILVLGGVMVDHYIFVDKYPSRGGDTTVHNEEQYVGSTSYNLSNALKNLELNPIIYTHIGKDSNGLFIREKMLEHNFDFTLVFEDEEPSGICHVVLDSLSERTFFSYPKCESKFYRVEIPDAVLDATKYIYVSGIFLANTTNKEELVKYVEDAAKREIRIIFDACPLVNTIPENLLKRMMNISSLVKANYEEYAVIKPFVKDDQIILISDGRNGSRILSNKKEITHIAYQANVVDTNGAGDNFLAGYIYGYINNYSASLCLDMASACGKIACETLGTTPKFTIESVQKIIAKSK